MNLLSSSFSSLARRFWTCKLVVYSNAVYPKLTVQWVCFVTRKRFSISHFQNWKRKYLKWEKCNPAIYRFTFWAYLSQEIHNCLFDRDVVNSTSSDSNPPLSKQLMSELRSRGGLGLKFLSFWSLWDKITFTWVFGILLEPKFLAQYFPNVVWNWLEWFIAQIHLYRAQNDGPLCVNGYRKCIVNDDKWGKRHPGPKIP